MALFLFFMLASIFSIFNMHLIMGFSGDGRTVAVNKGARTFTYRLDQDLTVNLADNSEVCLMDIKNNKVRIKESSCPRQICVRTGKIDSPGQAIICLHHKISLEIKGDDDYDASIR